MNQKILGYFEKPMARRFKEALEEDGVNISAEPVRVPQSGPKIKMSVDANDYTRALELVRKLEVQYLIKARERTRSYERKAITMFFIFAVFFIAYIIVSNL